MYPVNVLVKLAILQSVASSIPEIIAIGVSNPNLGEDEAVVGRGWHRSKERW